MRRFLQDFFYVVDRYVRKVRATDRKSHEFGRTFYKFCNFNILGIVQFKYFDDLKSIVYIRQMHILSNSRKSTFPKSADLFP